MGDIDFRFLVKGASLVTKRFVGEVDGYSFYSQPICNEDFPFFRDLKKLLFGHKFRVGLILNLIKNIPSCIAFAWYMIVLKKMYVHKGAFFLQIDIEAPRESGKITLNDENDNYGEKSIDVDLSILPKTGELFTKARAIIKDYLDKSGVEYEELPFSTSAEHYEDVYHPFGMFSDFDNVEDYFSYFNNMLVVNNATENYRQFIKGFDMVASAGFYCVTNCPCHTGAGAGTPLACPPGCGSCLSYCSPCPEELIGKKVVLVANLKPVKLCGEDSYGMILAADCSENDVKVLFLDDSMPEGSLIR
jgi:hypothetical protein